MSIETTVRKSKELLKADKHAEALGLLSEALRENADARLFYSRAMTFDQMGEAEKSVEDLTSAIEIDRTNPTYFFDRACILAYPLRKHEEAIHDFEQVLQLSPNHVEAHRQCSGQLLIIQKPQLALEHAEAAFRLAPDDANTHFFLGEAYISLKRYDKAVASLRRAVDLDPNQPENVSALDRALKYSVSIRTEDDAGKHPCDPQSN